MSLPLPLTGGQGALLSRKDPSGHSGHLPLVLDPLAPPAGLTVVPQLHPFMTPSDP